jgi:xylulokinase
MNVTVATEMVRRAYNWEIGEFDTASTKCPPGADGLVLLPYLEGERTPNVPAGTGVFLGVNHRTFTPNHFARAAMEGATLGMNYGLRRLAELGVKPTQIRATGGGSQKKVWRRIMADVFGTPVVTLKVAEGAAYGAALQAFWCWRLQQGDKAGIEDITDEYVTLNQAETTEPIAANVEVYRQMQALQDKLSLSLREAFLDHRQLVSRA